MIERCKKIVEDSVNLFKNVLHDEKLLKKVAETTTVVVNCIKGGGKILICGNGGSAADAQHFAAELVGSFMIKDRKGFPAIALTSDSAVLTSLCNDTSVEQVFARQVEALGKTGDLVIGITTSGNSKNVINALRIAKSAGLKTVCITGLLPENAEIKLSSDIVVDVPSSSTPRIQEVHGLLIHVICEIVESTIAVKRA
ncbi:MAG: SIS domain-containing protein [Synergistaceae bacterium]|nr:SIS domain-containing protein [Synergistaceae bacterium]